MIKVSRSAGDAKPKAKTAAKPKAGAKPKSKTGAKAKPRPKVKAGPHKGEEKPKPNSRLGDRKLSIDDVMAALRQTGGLKTAAASVLKCSRTTLYKFIAENEELQDFSAEIDEEIKDLAEAKILQALRAGDMQTVRWYMELKAKDRGYARRVENTGPNGGPMQVEQKLDLSKLSKEELLILRKCAVERESQAGAA